MGNLMKIDKEYSEWVQEISRRYRRGQIKAAVRVNNEMLRFYWSLGKDIVDMRAESKWGSGFYDSLSRDLQDAIPDTKGFSPSNLNYMKRVYELFKPLENGHHQVDGELELNNIFRIPWGHLKLLADKCKGDIDAPTVGLLVCRTKNNVLAKYAVDASAEPIGISEYDLSNLLPENVDGILPSIEEIERHLQIQG